MQASKWLDIPLLISAEEMELLFKHLHATVGPFQIFQTGVVLPLEQGPLLNFLEIYRTYSTALKEGRLPEKELFSTVWTLSPDVLTVQKIGTDRKLLKLETPAVQMQPHSMIYSKQDGKFYSMVYGRDAIFWGLQFSYPQIYLHPQTKEVVKVDKNFLNTQLFREIQLWIRQQTLPTPMKGPNGQLNLPIRLGKECFSWINNHPQLQLNQLACVK